MKSAPHRSGSASLAVVAIGIATSAAACGGGAAGPEGNGAASGREPVERTIERALAAQGGAGAVRALHRVVAEWETVDHWAFQSRRPDRPWDRSRGRRLFALDLEGHRFAEHRDVMSAGFYPFHDHFVIDGEEGFHADYYNGYRRELPVEELSRRSADLVRHSSPLLLRELDRRPELAKETAADEPAASTATPGIRWLDFELPDGEPVTLGFEADSGRLVRLRRFVEDVGAVEEVSFADFRRVRELLVNGAATVRLRGEVVYEIAVTGFDAAVDVEPHLTAKRELPEVTFSPPPGVYDFKLDEVAPGVYFVGDTVWHSLFVEYSDFFVVLGTVRGAASKLAAVRERAPGKPVRYAVVTHHHDDHLEGVADYVAAGAALVISPGHAAVVRGAAAGLEAQLVEVETELALGDPGRELRIFQAGPMSHAQEILVGHLASEGLLFAADLYVQHPGRPLRASNPPLRELAAFLAERRLPVALLFDPHSPVANPLESLQRSAATSPFWQGLHAIDSASIPSPVGGGARPSLPPPAGRRRRRAGPRRAALRRSSARTSAS